MFNSYKFILLCFLVSLISPGISFGGIVVYLIVMATLSPTKSLQYDLDKLDKSHPIVKYFEEHFDYKHKS